MRTNYVVQTGTTRHEVEVREVGDRYEVTIDGQVFEVDSCRMDGVPARSLIVGGRSFETSTVQDGDRYDVYLTGEIYPVTVYDEVWARASEAHGPRSSGEEITAPIPGSVVAILVAEGELVPPGKPVAVLEAMKMQNEILSRAGGRVTRIAVAAGDSVATGQTLIVLAPGEPAGETAGEPAAQTAGQPAGQTTGQTA